jgi:hypothetical protein
MWHHARRFVAGLTARVVAPLVDGGRELGNLALAMAVQASLVLFNGVQDGRRWRCFMTYLAGVVGAPFVILRNGLLAHDPVTGSAILAVDRRVGEGRGSFHQRSG